MYIVNFWHTVADYTAWKSMFDSDPLGRESSGVRRYSIERPVGNEQLVVGHLEFATLDEAEAFAGRLEEVWKGPASQVVTNSGQNISEKLEEKQIGAEAGRRAA